MSHLHTNCEKNRLFLSFNDREQSHGNRFFLLVMDVVVVWVSRPNICSRPGRGSSNTNIVRNVRKYIFLCIIYRTQRRTATLKMLKFRMRWSLMYTERLQIAQRSRRNTRVPHKLPAVVDCTLIIRLLLDVSSRFIRSYTPAGEEKSKTVLVRTIRVMTVLFILFEFRMVF